MKDIKGWTTREESKSLIKAGLAAKAHDMHYYYANGIFQLRCTAHLAVKDNLFSYRNGLVIPCWSLGRLIELAESYEGAKVSYDDHCWVIKQRDIRCVGESLPEVMIEFLKRRKEE